MFHDTPDWARRRPDFAIDLGTANTTVIERLSGIVFEQPSICCFDEGAHSQVGVFAAGEAARRMVGREVGGLRTVRPLRNGVLVDVRATSELLRYATDFPRGRRLMRRSRVVIGVPTDATQAERRALGRAAHDAGLAEPWLMPEPMLAAMGSGLCVEEARGRMVVDCGAGTTDVVVLSLGTVCVARSVRGGGDAMVASLIHHLHHKRHFLIGPSSAEGLKLAVSQALGKAAGLTFVEVKGLDQDTRLPRTMSLDVEELRPVVERYADDIVAAVRTVFSLTAPELASGILEDGITLTGGAASTALVADRLRTTTGIAVNLAEDPRRAVVRGLERVLG